MAKRFGQPLSKLYEPSDYAGGEFPNNIDPNYFGGPLAGSYGAGESEPGYTFRPTSANQQGGYYYNTPSRDYGSTAQGLGLDPDLESITDRIFGYLDRDRKFNIAQRDQAIKQLRAFGANVENALPLNPYSDELRTAVLARSQDEITRTGQQQFETQRSQLSGHGYTGLDTNVQTAAGGIQADIMGQRIGAETKTSLDQLAFNTMSNQAREELLAQIEGQQANIQAGNVVNPETFADTLSNAFGIQLSEENRQEFMDYIATLEPDLQDKLLSAIPMLTTALFPGGPRAQAAGQTINTLFGQGY